MPALSTRYQSRPAALPLLLPPGPLRLNRYVCRDTVHIPSGLLLNLPYRLFQRFRSPGYDDDSAPSAATACRRETYAFAASSYDGPLACKSLDTYLIPPSQIVSTPHRIRQRPYRERTTIDREFCPAILTDDYFVIPRVGQILERRSLPLLLPYIHTLETFFIHLGDHYRTTRTFDILMAAADPAYCTWMIQSSPLVLHMLHIPGIQQWVNCSLLVPWLFTVNTIIIAIEYTRITVLP